MLTNSFATTRDEARIAANVAKLARVASENLKRRVVFNPSIRIAE
jgi:hypothetical protein